MAHSRESRGDAEESRLRACVKKWFSAFLRLPISTCSFFFALPKTSASRRAFLQGRVWKLPPRDRFPPLVRRYPKPEPAEPMPVKSLQGISIEPVAVTDLSKPAVRHIPVHRPPGAVEESQFMAGCTRCGDCITACPYDAIRKAPERLVHVADTPIIEADVSACTMCKDFPCIASCGPGVLTGDVPILMGTAKVTEHLCLAHHGTTCTVCSERCPVEGAITLTDGKPTVDEECCTGCGMCRYVCPAPENAILLMPALVRPAMGGN